ARHPEPIDMRLDSVIEPGEMLGPVMRGADRSIPEEPQEGGLFRVLGDDRVQNTISKVRAQHLSVPADGIRKKVVLAVDEPCTLAAFQEIFNHRSRSQEL